jgi:general secretion pathway protein C
MAAATLFAIPSPRVGLGAGAAAALAAALLIAVDRPAEAPTALPPATPPPPVVRAAAPAAPALTPADISGVSIQGVLGGHAAIIADGGVQRRVAIGQPVRPGMTLAAVGRDHVIVARGGEALHVPLARFGAPAAVTVVPETSVVSEKDEVAEPSRAEPVLSRADYAGAMRKRQLIAFQLGLDPVQSGETTIGFRITNVESMPLFKAAGLADGDIVTAIDGNGLNDEEKIIELPDELAQAKRIRIDWQRGDGRRSSIVRFQD